jgi:AraC-like DNA-binding protein
MKTLTAGEYFADPAFPFRLMRMAQQSTHRHAHEFAELVIVLRGHGIHETDEGDDPIASGDVFVVQLEQVHGFRETYDLALVNLLYQPERLDLPESWLRKLPGYHALFILEPHYRRQRPGLARMRLTREELAHVEVVLEMIEAEMERRAPGYEASAQALFVQLMVYLARGYQRQSAPTSLALLRLANVLTLIEERYAEKLTLRQLADAAHLSPSHFSRVFKEATGVAPMDYVIRCRVRRAAELLRAGSDSITDIALQVGCSDSAYFSRLFANINGISPRRYRQLMTR